MANIAAARIQREFKEVVKSEEVTCVFIGELKYSFNKCYFQFEFPREKKKTDSIIPVPGFFILDSLLTTI